MLGDQLTIYMDDMVVIAQVADDAKLRKKVGHGENTKM